jgi:hypothetical protein
LARGLQWGLVMSLEHPFRSPASSASVEFRCPYCERNLYIAPLEALVSLTTCPHSDCQHVAVVCTREALGRDLLASYNGCVAMTLERFVDVRRRVSWLDAMTTFLALGPLFLMFGVAPWTMLSYAWQQGRELWVTVAMFTTPAALIGLSMIVGILACEWDERRDCRKLAAVRRQAFARARWQIARVRPQQV